ncbi:GNAT family N-acetyltransferase [Lacticaseibacillus brantae]|nr:GNAT family N-acetyltransferase [Lacticaseibacillus brantae]
MATFARATLTDLPAIVAIYNQNIAGHMVTADLAPVTVVERRPWFEAYSDAYPLWVLKDEIAVIGWVGLEPFYGRAAYAHTAEISLYIDQDQTHHGFGQASLDFVQTQLPRLRINTLLAYVFSHNLPSAKLFAKNGFETWGHLPDVAVLDKQLRSLDILGRHYL